MYELKHSKAEIEARPLCPYNNKKTLCTYVQL